MLVPRPNRRAAALALALIQAQGAGAALAAAALLASPPALAQADTYKLHMENGVKLYNDRNYPAAIIEFLAAYDARPNANPLVNIALAEKEQYRYHKAIAALEQALAKHGDTMAPPDRKAAEDAIKDMRALLGRVIVKVVPPNATLVVDGDDQPADATGKPVPLGPGKHTIEAHAEGFASAQRTVVVASGQTEQLAIELVADKGLVTVHAPNPGMTITVDDRIVGTGVWSGLLAPGAHAVQASGASGPAYEGQILVIAGQPLDVRQGMGLAQRKDAGPALRRGVYVLGTGSLLFSPVRSPYFDMPDTAFGAGFGVRVGYQVNNVAGFDLSYQHSAIQTVQVDDVSGQNSYRIVSERAAAGLRLTTSGKTWRFVGAFAGGVVYDQVQWGENAKLPKFCTAGPCPNVHGLDAFAVLEAVAELDVDRVLIDLGLETQFQSTGNMSGGQDETTFKGSLYGTRPIINIGPALRVGYRFW